VSITVTGVNDPPIAGDDSYSVSEDELLTVSASGVLGNDSDPEGDTLRAVLVSGPSNGTLVLSTNGGFVYTPATNFNGSDSFTYRATDGMTNSGVATVNLTVTPVNDAPSFTKGPNQLVQQNAGLQTAPSWASGISPGPPDEAGQTIAFLVSNDTNALFSAQPAVTPEGTLTYTPAPDSYGVALVTVTAIDNGGTANGGINTSSSQTFTITVNAPPTVSIVSPTNGAVFIAPASFTVVADAQDADGSIARVDFFSDTNFIGEASSEPYFILRTNLATGAYIFNATATDNLGATGAASPVTVTVIERPPLSNVSVVYFNPQTDFFEQQVRVFNPTYSTFAAVRVYVYNLTNVPPITVHNYSGLSNGIPYVQTQTAVPPGGFVDLIIEYFSPLRIAPNPVLQAELVPASGVTNELLGTMQRIDRAVVLSDRSFMVEFLTLSNRVYAIQYSPDLIRWNSAKPPVQGDGSRVQWIDNGEPKTDGAPASQPARYYRVLLLP
jgi:hypothetical protein